MKESAMHLNQSYYLRLSVDEMKSRVGGVSRILQP